MSSQTDTRLNHPKPENWMSLVKHLTPRQCAMTTLAKGNSTGNLIWQCQLRNVEDHGERNAHLSLPFRKTSPRTQENDPDIAPNKRLRP